jgi:hypothetical protein
MPRPNIIWLASYPKSGNTWFRAFLSALLNDNEQVDINGLKMNAIFASREIFDAFTDLDSASLYDEEVKEKIPWVYQQLSDESLAPRYIKVHDAYTFNSAQQPIIPTDATICAIYFIRNPLDLAASFANHISASLDHAIGIMNNPNGCLCAQKNNLNTNKQFRQLMLSWSMHVKSWTNHSAFPVMVVRYEDMLNDTFNTFAAMTDFIGLKATPEKIRVCIEQVGFEKLQEKESESGFREKLPKTKQFFRSGKAGNWKHELTREQALSIVQHHYEMMKQFSYDPNVQDNYS